MKNTRPGRATRAEIVVFCSLHMQIHYNIVAVTVAATPFFKRQTLTAIKDFESIFTTNSHLTWFDAALV